MILVGSNEPDISETLGKQRFSVGPVDTQTSRPVSGLQYDTFTGQQPSMASRSTVRIPHNGTQRTLERKHFPLNILVDLIRNFPPSRSKFPFAKKL